RAAHRERLQQAVLCGPIRRMVDVDLEARQGLIDFIVQEPTRAVAVKGIECDVRRQELPRLDGLERQTARRQAQGRLLIDRTGELSEPVVPRTPDASPSFRQAQETPCRYAVL